MDKFLPQVGDKLYLQKRTGSYYVDMCKDPYTVIAVSNSAVTIQEARLVFNGPRYFDTLPDDIQADPEGEILTLHWGRKHGTWQVDRFGSGYPSYAHFGKYDYQPYLD